MSTPDIPSDAHEQWARHPITSKYRKGAEASVRAARIALLNAAVGSTDPKVTRAYAYLEAAEALDDILSPKEAPDA